MTLTKHRKLWTVGGVCLLTLTALAAWRAMPAAAQAPARPAGLPKKIFTKSLSFDLPVLMEDATRQTLREVCLFVKEAGGAWMQHDRAAPTATKFTYRAKQDGEYWFNLVTVDKQGRSTPTDVNAEAPGLRVVVDTKAPVIDVQVLPGTNGECALRGSVQDANPDPTALRAFGRGTGGDTVLEAMPGQPGVFIVRAEMLNHPVRVTAGDLAGNTAARDVNVKEMLAALNPVTPAPSPLTTVSNTAPAKVSTSEPVTPSLPTPQGPLGTADKTPAPGALVPAAVTPAAPLTPVPATSPAPATAPAKMPVLPLDGQPAPKGGAANRRIINTTRASIDYRIDQVGPSGVGKVAVYVTHDQGTSWRRAGDDADRQSPAEIDLPGEGLFGIRLAITNGNGFGGTPPARGEAPQCWVEVDTTPPFVQLRPAEVAPGGSALDIRWNATDPNLGPEAVSLFYRTRPDGPWEALARGIKNESVYRWAFPREVGGQLYFKVEVTDLAGNVARAESQAPVILDMTEPRASVLGVTGMGKSH